MKFWSGVFLFLILVNVAEAARVNDLTDALGWFLAAGIYIELLITRSRQNEK